MIRYIFIAALFVCLTNEATPAVFTVGPGGSHADLPSAWQALAASGPGSHELRIATGTFALTQSLVLMVSDGSTVEISGSWDAGFQARTGDRSLTQIRGAGMHRLMELSATGGQLTLAHLSLAEGAANRGGLVTADISGSAQFRIRNAGFSDAEAIGICGCMCLAAAGSASVLLSDVSFTQCRVNRDVEWGRERGSALILEARHAANVRIDGLVARDNLTEATDGSIIAGTAIELTADDTVKLSMENFDISDNRAVQVGMSTANPSAGLLVSAPWLNLTGTPEVDIRRGRLSRNVCEACVNSRQFLIGYTSGARIRVSDTLIADGHSALNVLTDFSATNVAEFVNLTVTRHSIRGIDIHANPIAVPPPVLASLSNSVLHDNVQELSSNGMIESSNNLIGSNPQFVNPAAGDFRPADLSPMIDAGSNSVGELGQRDLEGMPRIFGPAVDIGAYEWRPGAPMFGSGFE